MGNKNALILFPMHKFLSGNIQKMFQSIRLFCLRRRFV